MPAQTSLSLRTSWCAFPLSALGSGRSPTRFSLTCASSYSIRTGQIVDEIGSYAGLRSVSIDGRAVLINSEVVFQRLVLDQGLYADGLQTAPTDEALIRDIPLSMGVGYNGARQHIHHDVTVLDASGYAHRVYQADIYDSLNYDQDPVSFGQTMNLLDNVDMFGYCYTQLTHAFQEQNGIYGFDRSDQFDVARIRAVQTRVADIEAAATGIQRAVASPAIEGAEEA